MFLGLLLFLRGLLVGLLIFWGLLVGLLLILWSFPVGLLLVPWGFLPGLITRSLFISQETKRQLQYEQDQHEDDQSADYYPQKPQSPFDTLSPPLLRLLPYVLF